MSVSDAPNAVHPGYNIDMKAFFHNVQNEGVLVEPDKIHIFEEAKTVSTAIKDVDHNKLRYDVLLSCQCSIMANIT